MKSHKHKYLEDKLERLNLICPFDVTLAFLFNGHNSEWIVRYQYDEDYDGSNQLDNLSCKHRYLSTAITSLVELTRATMLSIDAFLQTHRQIKNSEHSPFTIYETSLRNGTLHVETLTFKNKDKYYYTYENSKGYRECFRNLTLGSLWTQK